MIELIVSMLAIDDFYNKSERIDIAKGKHELTTSFKEAWKQHKRQ
jgi:hypothetical protein